jgi:hypothetical protein
MVVVVARRGRAADVLDATWARNIGDELLALLVPDDSELAVDERAGAKLDAGAGCETPLLERFMIGNAAALRNPRLSAGAYQKVPSAPRTKLLAT